MYTVSDMEQKGKDREEPDAASKRAFFRRLRENAKGRQSAVRPGAGGPSVASESQRDLGAFGKSAGRFSRFLR